MLCIDVYIYVCVCVCLCVCIHTHTHTHTLLSVFRLYSGYPDLPNVKVRWDDCVASFGGRDWAGGHFKVTSSAPTLMRKIT
jgi:hypothetical protein